MTQQQARLEQVSNETKQARDVPARSSWTEAAVWTDRMLMALENGVKGGRWHSLIDKVYSLRNLRAAFYKVKKNRGAAGCDHQTIAMFESRLEANLLDLSQQLRAGTYQPRKIKRVHIPKPGSRKTRPLGIPTVRDRVVQAALRSVIEPVFEHDFAGHSYGFRPGRGCKDALRRVDTLLKAGYTHVVDADLKSYFDTIPHDLLMGNIQEKIADSCVLKLIESFLTQRVMDGMDGWTPTAGSPQGAVISPLLSNVYLTPLDNFMEFIGFEMVRYADDFVVLCRSKTEAELALERVKQWVANAGLTLHPGKTRIADLNDGGFDFLGYHFENDKRYPSKKSKQKFKAVIRLKTRRLNGKSLYAIIADLNRTTKGWFEYFKHTQTGYRRNFDSLDNQIRRRLRRILLKRIKKHKHNGLANAHYKWPNTYFAKHGLFSLEQAHALARQSAAR